MAVNPSISTFTAGGQTVSLTWTTSSNAAIAQAAMSALQTSVTSGAETVVSYTGGSTLPALPGTVTGIVVAEGAGSAAHGPLLLTGKYDVGMSNDTSASPAAQSWVVGIGTANDTVMVGDGGGEVVNLGVNTQIYMTGQKIGTSSVAAPQVINQVGLIGAPAPSADAWVDGNATLNGSTGSTTINLDTVTAAGTVPGFASTIIVNNSGDGKNTIDIATSTVAASVAAADGVSVQSDIIGLAGNSSIAATINAGGSGTATAAAGTQQAEAVVFLSATANGVVNGGAANVILFGAGAQGSATLFGGTGSDINAGAGGLIEAGTGGKSFLFSSFTQATTLVGGGGGDVLATVLLAATTVVPNQFMQAGAGSETLASFNQGAVFWGLGVTSLGQATTMGSATTSMIGEIGGNKFDMGEGTAQVQAFNFGTNTYKESVSVGAATNTATIAGFNVGSDTVSLSNPAGGKYTTVSGSTAGAGQIAVNVAGGNTTLAFGDGTKWTIVGAALGNSNFG